MSAEAQKEFISALRCLKSKPGKTDQGEFPGARSRWDDIVVGHLLNVMSVHRSPWLGVWHRHYLWVLERALREECGYTGGAHSQSVRLTHTDSHRSPILALVSLSRIRRQHLANVRQLGNIDLRERNSDWTTVCMRRRWSSRQLDDKSGPSGRRYLGLQAESSW